MTGHGIHCRASASYKGKALPGSSGMALDYYKCLDCWAIYFAAHRSEPVTGEVMLAFIHALKAIEESADESALRELARRIQYEPDDL